MTPSPPSSLGASNQNTPTDDEEGWTLVAYNKIRKPRPQATWSNEEQARKHSRHDSRKPKRNVKAAKLTYAGEVMEQESRIPVFLHEYFPKDFFQ
ncbi:hypothetical protein ACFX19_032842 [Malus domestica]